MRCVLDSLQLSDRAVSFSRGCINNSKWRPICIFNSCYRVCPIKLASKIINYQNVQLPRLILVRFYTEQVIVMSISPKTRLSQREKPGIRRDRSYTYGFQRRMQARLRRFDETVNWKEEVPPVTMYDVCNITYTRLKLVPFFAFGVCANL